METIRMYLSNTFAAFPDTAEVRKLREDLLSTMEDKYNELRGQGRSEHEAVGVVLSEFGNINEIMQEMGLQPRVHPAYNVMDQAAAEEYYAEKNRRILWTVLDIVNAAWWPLIVAIYFIWSVFGHAWNISWIIWPISPALYWVFRCARTILKDRY